MKLDPLGRRMFLTGAGAALALPFLSSLLPRAARATTPTHPLRYIQILNPYGATTQQFYGDLTGDQPIQEYVAARQLSSVSGPISPLVGPAFAGLLDKISLIHGLDVMTENTNHQMCFATCASGYAPGVDADETPPAAGRPSIDVLLSTSDKVYDPTFPTARRLLTMNPVTTDTYTETRSFSWRETADGLEMIRPVKTTVGLQDLLGGAFDGSASGDVSGQAVLDAVYEDYRRVRDHQRLSRTDKERLESYLQLVSELEPGEIATCDHPALGAEPDIDAIVDNQFKLLTAALLCDVTRVASITLGMSEVYNARHNEHHDEMHTATADQTGLFGDLVEVGERVAKLIGELDAAQEGEGTLLDSSLVYWGMQYGNAVAGDAHRPFNMPALVAGSAGGQLRTGYYIDYRKDGHLSDREPRGIPMSNLLVTFMNCFGLGSGDYEAGGEAGYGFYRDVYFQNPIHPNPEFWNSSDGRRSALPWYYTGAERG
ncbi:MAG: DUF1552 domain-containing protein [Myxococcota bacterium]